MLKKYSLFILLWIIPQISCDWIGPDFFSEAGHEKITFGETTTTSQTIYAHEELPVPFTIAIINCDSAHTAELEGFNIGSNIELDVTLNRRPDSRYDVTVGLEQDFEKISKDLYRFTIKINNISKSIVLSILNLIDTPPSVEYNVPCTVKELQPENTETDCIFDVFVADGFEYNVGKVEWTNKITTELPAAENELFEIEEVPSSILNKNIKFQLKLKKTLYFVNKPLYNFRAIFKNKEGDSSSVLIIIELEDLPNMIPTWVTPFAMQTFEERLDWSFTVEATDGDTGINDKIEFEIVFDPNDKDVYEKWILLGPSTDNKATISVAPGGIDRDLLEKEIFRFDIIAYKTPDGGEKLVSPSSALIVVTDINNQIPEIQILNAEGEEIYEIEIEEEKLLTLEFAKIIVHDRDLENNATYEVRIEHVDDIAYSQPFSIVPENGYQRSDFFKINVFQLENNLDFENDDWKSFDIYLVAQETDTVERQFDRKKITITLKNWNDELPIFEKPDGYTIDVDENVPANILVLTVKAIDKDEEDKVTHSILGSLADLLDIDPETGDITTNRENTFDYEKQTQVILQVMAKDELVTGVVGETIHQVFAQVTININDINDETPEIRMPPVPVIEENLAGGILVTDLIEARDPDSTADLQFTILWAESSATKSGQYADPVDYEECFIIRNKVEEVPNNKIVFGELVVNPDFVIPKVKDIDYEKFEVLYLTIQVEDLNQFDGVAIATAQITVRVTDVNDNEPEFIEQTLLVDRNVVESALAGTQIGTILAQDLDGPDYNIIEYEIEPLDSSMPDDWFVIDDKGVIRVKDGAIIDCDTPPRMDVEYVIKLINLQYKVPGNIKIRIIDTNNKIPEILPFENEITIEEKTTKTGHFLTQVQATDADRDDEHKEISYFIDTTYEKAGNYFVIDRKTGELTVQLNGEVKFDYDEGEQSYDIPIEVYDTVTSTVINRNSARVRVYLIDVNDHSPEFIGTYSPKISEDSAIGVELDELCASDKDSDDNAKVSFILDSIVAFEGVESAPPDENLFEVIPSRDNCMKLKVSTLLKGYFGIWEVKITARDHGDLDKTYGAQETQGIFYVEITPFNYHEPEIRYPSSTSIRLSNSQVPSSTLTDVNNEQLRAFEAYDPDGGVLGEVEFRITATLGQNADDIDFFKFLKNDGKTSNLQTTKSIDGKNVYHITCTAVDGGGLTSTSMDLTITFVNILGVPYFTYPEDFTFFNEKDKGLVQSYIIPEGTDPMNLGLPEVEYAKVYYFLAKTESEPYFNLDRETRELTLKQALDRNENERHILKIMLSRNENIPTNTVDDSILTLNILVNAADTPNVDPIRPTIFYPFTNTLRLLAGQMTNVNLLDTTSSILRSFEAFGRNADRSTSDITFKISEVPGELDDSEYFKIEKTADINLSNLQLAKEIDHPNPYNIRITAIDSSLQESDPLNLKIIFVDMNSAPYFEVLDELAFISENEIGLTEHHKILEAIEPRNEGLVDDLEKIYYFIDTTYISDDASKFAIGSESREVTLREKLDREVKETYVIRIIVTRNPTAAPVNPPTTSILLLTVIVLDVNDNPPVFDRDVFGVGITTSDRTGKSLTLLRATDLDLNETITYHIIPDTFKAIGEGIDAVGVTSFDITNENSVGNLILNFIPRASMTGYFEFNIEAHDNDATHKVRALVKIYIIADANRVTFVFVNKLSDIELTENIQFIVDLFQEKFGFECNVDEAVSATDDNGLPLEGLTNVRVHFIKDNEAIPAETIQQKASDVVFITQLKSLLAQRQLILQEVPTGSAISADTNKAELLQTILIVLSVVLGILCAVLIIAFFLRTRNLRRQLKAMSTVDFGSTSSNLNRQAPTTNVFSVEGSNPVLNNNNLKPMFDNISVHSNESDFAGIQDDPTFKHRRESINPEIIEEIRRKSINPMVNGKVNGSDSNYI